MSSMPDESSVLAKSDHEGDNQNMEVVVETSENDITMNGEAEESPVTTATSRVLEYLQEAREEGGERAANSSVFHGYRSHGREEEEEEESQEGSHGSHPPQTNGRASPAASFSTPDDTPSVHVSASAVGGWKLCRLGLILRTPRALWRLHVPVAHLDLGFLPLPLFDRLIEDFNLVSSLGL